MAAASEGGARTVEYELSIEEHNLMCKYIQRGFKDTLRKFLEGLTSTAAKESSGDVMVVLGKRTFAPDPNSNRVAPLVMAALEGRIQIVQLFLEAFKEVIDINHGSYLVYPNLFLLDYKQVDEMKSRGVTAINAACVSGLMDIVKIFVHAGANINKVDYFGLSPLGNAARYGQKEAVEFLLRRGANITLKTHEGYTSMHLAAYYGQAEIVRVLLSKMISPCYPKDDRPPEVGPPCPMYLAAARGWQDVVDEFSKHPPCPAHCKIDASLLLGAAARMYWSQSTPENISGVSDIWREARKQAGSGGKLPGSVPPVKAYGNRKELTSEQDIKTLSASPDFETKSLYQCLLIHERCMGKQNSYRWVFLAGVQMYQRELFQEAEELWARAIELHYENAKEHIGLDKFWKQDLKGCMECMLQYSKAMEVMTHADYAPCWSAYTEYALQQLKLGLLTNLETNLLDPTQGILKVYFCLLQIFSCWVSTKMDPPTLSLLESARRYPEDLERHGLAFVDTVSVITQSNLVHLSIHPAAPIIQRSDHWQTFKRLPNLLVSLLDWGAVMNIDDVDHNGERPLHIAAKLPNRELREILVPILLHFGAHPDALNQNGLTPEKVFTAAYPMEKSPFPDTPKRLECMAVDYVIKHKVPYNSRKFSAKLNLVFKLHSFDSSAPLKMKKITLPNLF